MPAANGSSERNRTRAEDPEGVTWGDAEVGAGPSRYRSRAFPRDDRLLIPSVANSFVPLSSSNHNVGTTDSCPREAGYRLCGTKPGEQPALGVVERIVQLTHGGAAGQAPSQQDPDGRRDGRRQALDEPLR